MPFSNKKHRIKNIEAELSFLYNLKGKINLQMKYESTNKSIRQVIHSLPLVIIGHLIYENAEWISAGALMAEHLTKKFVPRAEKWLEGLNLHVNPNINEPDFNFDTLIRGYSLLRCDGGEQIIRGCARADWNEFPYKLEYQFQSSVSSTALEKYKWLVYNYAGQLRDERFRTYIQAVIDSQQKGNFDGNYDVKRAMDAVVFLV